MIAAGRGEQDDIGVAGVDLFRAHGDAAPLSPEGVSRVHHGFYDVGFRGVRAVHSPGPSLPAYVGPQAEQEHGGLSVFGNGGRPFAYHAFRSGKEVGKGLGFFLLSEGFPQNGGFDLNCAEVGSAEP